MDNPVTKAPDSKGTLSTDPTVAQLHTDGGGGVCGSDSSHEVPSKTAAIVTVDNSPEATCSTCRVVSDRQVASH